MIYKLKNIVRRYKLGKFYEENILLNPENTSAQKRSNDEINSLKKRHDVINLLIKSLNKPITYLEIGVRNPNHNFNLIKAETKYSVDPGIEYAANPVDFKMTSDDFFHNLDKGSILSKNIKFDIIYIDGMHLAHFVNRDISNSLRYLKDDGFIVLHDCNPPTEWHARENYDYEWTPALKYWNGSTWKAFIKQRKSKHLFSCCVDIDWGVGILSRKINLGSSYAIDDEFYEYNVFNKNRKDALNLTSYLELEEKLKAQ